MNTKKQPTIGHNSKQTLKQFERLAPIAFHPIDEFVAHHRNPRKHPERQIVTLMASVSEFGIMMPALIDKNKVIIVGEARIEAARRVGYKEYPAIEISHLTQGQIQAYRLTDNKMSDLSHFDLLQRIANVLDVPLVDLIQEPVTADPVGERARLEWELRRLAEALPIDRLRIAARQMVSLAEG